MGWAGEGWWKSQSPLTITGAMQRLSVVLVRHGKTDWNVEQRWQGATDTSLNEEGREQARQAALGQLSTMLPIDRVYTSPLRRAVETAEIIIQTWKDSGLIAADSDLTPIPHEGFKEPSLGPFEGMVRGDILAKYSDKFSHLQSLSHNERIHASYFPETETVVETNNRLLAGLDAIHRTTKAREGTERVLVITHSKVMESMLSVEYGAEYDSQKSQNLGTMLLHAASQAEAMTADSVLTQVGWTLHGLSGFSFRIAPDSNCTALSGWSASETEDMT